MNIIGEIPPIYANIDPSYFDNTLDHPNITKDEVEISKLDSFYIDQLGAMLQALNMNIIEMRWELVVAKNPNVNSNNPIGSKDSLFIYIGSSWWFIPNSQTYGANDIHDFKYNGGSMEFPEPKNNARIDQPPNDVDDILYYDTNDDDYSDLILNHDHFEKGKSSIGMFISYHDKIVALVNKTLHDVIREAYFRQPSCTKDAYDLRVGILMDV